MPICEFCEKELKSDRSMDAHVRRFHGQTLEDLAGLIDADSIEGDSNGAAPKEVVQEDESEDLVLKPSWRKRFWRDTPPTLKKTRTKRVETDAIWQGLWTVIGAGLEKTGADIPVGRAMQFQAPTVGPMVDTAIRETLLDTLVQPLAQNSGKAKVLAAVFGLPGIVYLLERNPEMAPALEPLARMVIEENMIAMVPVLKAKQRKEKEWRKVVEELTELTGEDLGPSPVDDILNMIFAPIPGQAEPEFSDATSS